MRNLVPGLLVVTLWASVCQSPAVGQTTELRQARPSEQGGTPTDHLLKAAAHLEAAGLPEKAAECRRLAEQERGRPRQPVNSQQILFHMQVVEASLTRLRAKGIDPAVLLSAQLEGPDCRVASPKEVMRLMESLARDSLARILAEPMLVTVDGRPARFHSGGTFPSPQPGEHGTVTIEQKPLGTTVDLVATLLSKERVRLEFHVAVRELDAAPGVRAGDGTVPGVRVRELETKVEMGFGQTMIFGGLTQIRDVSPSPAAQPSSVAAPAQPLPDGTEEFATLILIRPELVEGIAP